MLPAVLYIPLLVASYFIFDLFHTETAEIPDKTLQTTEFLNPDLPDARLKGGDGIGSKYENMAKSWGKIQDYSAVDNIERDEPDDNKEEYESQYTVDDIALLDEQQQEKAAAAQIADAKTLELLDTPGILWPKFEDQRVGLLLAFIGSINDEILNKDELALELLKLLQKHYPDVLKERYKIDETSEENLLIQVAKVRGCLAKGGEPDYSRAAALVIDDYRSGKLGRITLEFPPVKKNDGDKVDSVQESGAADQGSESGEA